MNTITRREIDALIAPGYVIAVEYIKKDLIAEVIAFGEDGRATHALCALGGLDIVEATCLGVFETNLHNYLRANTVLTIRKARPNPTQEEAAKATRFWNNRVLDPYDVQMIIGTLPILFAHHVLRFFSHRLAEWALQHMPNMLASSSLSTCAELGARGVQEFNLLAFSGYPLGSINPEILRTTRSLDTVAVLRGMTLVD